MLESGDLVVVTGGDYVGSIATVNYFYSDGYVLGDLPMASLTTAGDEIIEVYGGDIKEFK